MKILIINTYDIDGGAARATYRLHRALINEGVDKYNWFRVKKVMTIQ